MRIDFRARKTEAQWQEAADSFVTNLAPRWFDLMQWTGVLGLLDYAARKTGSVCVMVLSVISFALLMAYLNASLFKCEFDGLPFVRTGSAKRLVSLCISATVALGLLFIINRVVRSLTQQ
jgi:hypothetical protein